MTNMFCTGKERKKTGKIVYNSPSFIGITWKEAYFGTGVGLARDKKATVSYTPTYV